MANLVNFIVSGSAVNFYFRLPLSCVQPFHRLVTFHWGSVLAGSFLTVLFGIPDTIFDSLRVGVEITQPLSTETTYGRCCTNSCSWLYGVCDLVRSDAMAMIHLTGLPYCNSSRYC